MKLKVGDYVRLTRCRGIRKIKEYEENINCCIFDEPVLDRWGETKTFHILSEEDVVKSSSNIIDLIEVGDFVNGYRVDGLKGNVLECCDGAFNYHNKDIKSIVTKEQIESMEYKV